MLALSVHIVALAVYLGFTVALWLILLPAAAGMEAAEEGSAFLVRGLRIYNPTQIAALGILVLTGAFQITELKNIYRESYAAEFGGVLGVKLLVSFFIIMLGTYQCLGVGHRFVRLYEADQPAAATRLHAVVRKLRMASILVVPLVVYTVYLSLL